MVDGGRDLGLQLEAVETPRVPRPVVWESATPRTRGWRTGPNRQLMSGGRRCDVESTRHARYGGYCTGAIAGSIGRSCSSGRRGDCVRGEAAVRPLRRRIAPESTRRRTGLAAAPSFPQRDAIVWHGAPAERTGTTATGSMTTTGRYSPCLRQGFNGKTWLDQTGKPTSDALHFTERFRRTDSGTWRFKLQSTTRRFIPSSKSTNRSAWCRIATSSKPHLSAIRAARAARQGASSSMAVSPLGSTADFHGTIYATLSKQSMSISA